MSKLEGQVSWTPGWLVMSPRGNLRSIFRSKCGLMHRPQRAMSQRSIPGSWHYWTCVQLGLCYHGSVQALQKDLLLRACLLADLEGIVRKKTTKKKTACAWWMEQHCKVAWSNISSMLGWTELQYLFCIGCFYTFFTEFNQDPSIQFIITDI